MGAMSQTVLSGIGFSEVLPDSGKRMRHRGLSHGGTRQGSRSLKFQARTLISPFLSSLDQQKAQTYRAWARLRKQLERIKILVLGVEI